MAISPVAALSDSYHLGLHPLANICRAATPQALAKVARVSMGATSRPRSSEKQGVT